MASIKTAYGTSGVAITCTLTSLTSASSRQSASVDNTTNLYLDALVQVKVKTSSSALATTPYCTIYAYGSTDGGTTYPDAVTGSDAAYTPVSPTNLRTIGVLNCPSTSTTYVSEPMSVAAAFGGTLPDTWGIVVTNSTGQTLDASVGSAQYRGIYATSV